MAACRAPQDDTGCARESSESTKHGVLKPAWIRAAMARERRAGPDGGQAKSTSARRPSPSVRKAPVRVDWRGRPRARQPTADLRRPRKGTGPRTARGLQRLSGGHGGDDRPPDSDAGAAGRPRVDVSTPDLCPSGTAVAGGLASAAVGAVEAIRRVRRSRGCVGWRRSAARCQHRESAGGLLVERQRQAATTLTPGALVDFYNTLGRIDRCHLHCLSAISINGPMLILLPGRLGSARQIGSTAG